MIPFLQKKKTEKEEKRQPGHTQLSVDFGVTYRRTIGMPMEDPEQMWEWALKKIACYRASEIPAAQMERLEVNVIAGLPNAFCAHTAAFCDAAGRLTMVPSACQRMLEQDEKAAAKQVAEAAAGYLTMHWDDKNAPLLQQLAELLGIPLI